MNGEPLTRAARFVLMSAALVVFASCRTQYDHLNNLLRFPDPSPAACHATGNDPVPKPSTSDKPIVCVDDRDMNSVYVPDVVAKRNAPIKWFTVTGNGSIAVAFNDAAPIKHLICGQNKAFCQAVIDQNAEAPKDYPYTITVTRGGLKKTIDPTVQVDPGLTQWTP